MANVYITGLGIVAPNGIGLDRFWDSLLHGRSGIRRLDLDSSFSSLTPLGGSIPSFNLDDFLSRPVKVKRLGRHTQLSLAAMTAALADAKLTDEDYISCGRIPLCVGVSSSAFDVVEKAKEQLDQKGPRRVNPFMVRSSQPHDIASTLAEHVPADTLTQTYALACASGMQAIAEAGRMIREGKADIAIAGAGDCPVTPLAVAGFFSSHMVPEWQDEPEKACRPFDLHRKGGILAEGSGFLVLERADHARSRGARVYGELLGYGCENDPPGSEPGAGLKASMQHALDDSCLLPNDIDYVCAHGPGDPVVDRVETASVRHVLGDQAYRIPVSSIKAVTGNPLSAAGPFQVAASLLAMRDGMIPPTANLDSPDPECDLDHVPLEARRYHAARTLINVHGIGGVNSSLILQKASL